jgi:site-specific recombinase XerD
MGVDLRAASALMGHSNIQTTANIYTHQDNETLKQAAECMFEKMGVTPDAKRRLNA